MKNDIFAATQRMLGLAPGIEDTADLADEDADILRISRQTYEASTDWYESDLRGKWEHGIALFRSEHPPGSKYHSPAFRSRSKLFRPKTRSNLRRHEAAAAVAFFSTADLVSTEPGNNNDPKQRISAEIVGELLNIRLRSKKSKWFLTVMGAYQNTMVQGAVASKQSWLYKEQRIQTVETVMDSVTGETLEVPREEIEVLEDRPQVELIPLENLRFDPGANWTDPVNSSPYVIALYPMYVVDVLKRMENPDPKTGQPEWRKMSLSDILRHGRVMEDDQVRRARRGQDADDPYDAIDASEFSTVWVREYIVRTADDEDLIWYTLGDSALLTDPAPVTDVYLHGRPYVIGTSMLEAFNPIPDGLAYVGRHLQAKANEVDNQRFDNVRLVLNKRYFIRRGAKIDTRQLYNSVPGGAVTMNDPMGDIRWDETRDVTGSAYQEQDRVNLDFDELTGSMTQSTVQANRMLNETVGGMEMISSASDAVTEYQLRVFAETWVEPVLQQLALLEQKYETDDVVLAIAAGRSNEFQRYGMDRVYDWMLENEVIISVNVGMGATDPVQRVKRFMTGLQAVGGLPTAMARIEEDEVIAEVFGKLGYKDGSRFFKPLEEFKQQQQQQPPPDPRIMAEQIREQGRQQDRQIEMQRIQLEAQTRREIEFARMALERELTVQQVMTKTGVDREARLENAKVTLANTAMKERGRQVAESNKQSELAFKARTGREGI